MSRKTNFLLSVVLIVLFSTALQASPVLEYRYGNETYSFWGGAYRGNMGLYMAFDYDQRSGIEKIPGLAEEAASDLNSLDPTTCSGGCSAHVINYIANAGKATTWWFSDEDSRQLRSSGGRPSPEGRAVKSAVTKPKIPSPIWTSPRNDTDTDNTDNGFSSQSVQVATVREPSSLALLGLGIACHVAG